MDYFVARSGPVDWYPTKYDSCTLRATGKEYKFQKGSGRSEVLNRFARDGMLLGELTKAAAEAGFDPNFAVDACLKHDNTKDCAWAVDPPEGRTLADIKAERAERKLTEEQLAARDAKAAERAAKAEAKAAAKAEREAAKEMEAAERKAEREAARKAEANARAAEKAEADAAAKAAKHAETPLDLPESKKGKGKGKKVTEEVNAVVE